MNSLSNEEAGKLRPIIDRLATLRAQKKEIGEEEKELCDRAWEKCGIKPKVTKQLAKERAWDQLQRLAQLDLEQQLDAGRAALGELADTPLGQAAIENTKADAKEPHKGNGRKRYKKKGNTSGDNEKHLDS